MVDQKTLEQQLKHLRVEEALRRDREEHLKRVLDVANREIGSLVADIFPITGIFLAAFIGLTTEILTDSLRKHYTYTPPQGGKTLMTPKDVAKKTLGRPSGVASEYVGNSYETLDEAYAEGIAHQAKSQFPDQGDGLKQKVTAEAIGTLMAEEKQAIIDRHQNTHERAPTEEELKQNMNEFLADIAPQLTVDILPQHSQDREASHRR